MVGLPSTVHYFTSCFSNYQLVPPLPGGGASYTNNYVILHSRLAERYNLSDEIIYQFYKECIDNVNKG